MSKEVKLIKLILNRCEYVMSLDGEEWIIMIHVQQIKNQGQRLGSKILQYDAFYRRGIDLWNHQRTRDPPVDVCNLVPEIACKANGFVIENFRIALMQFIHICTSRISSN